MLFLKGFLMRKVFKDRELYFLFEYNSLGGLNFLFLYTPK